MKSEILKLTNSRPISSELKKEWQKFLINGFLFRALTESHILPFKAKLPLLDNLLFQTNISTADTHPSSRNSMYSDSVLADEFSVLDDVSDVQILRLQQRETQLDSDILDLKLENICGNSVTELLSDLIAVSENQLTLDKLKSTALYGYFGSVIRNLKLKLELIKCQSLYSIYAANDNSTLAKKFKDLTMSKSVVCEEINRLNSLLSQYQSVGADFQAIVDQYHRVSVSIEQLQSDLSRLSSQ